MTERDVEGSLSLEKEKGRPEGQEEEKELRVEPNKGEAGQLDWKWFGLHSQEEVDGGTPRTERGLKAEIRES